MDNRGVCPNSDVFMRTKILFLMMLVAAGLMTGCGKDSEETPTKPEDPIPPVTTLTK